VPDPRTWPARPFAREHGRRPRSGGEVYVVPSRALSSLFGAPGSVVGRQRRSSDPQPGGMCRANIEKPQFLCRDQSPFYSSSGKIFNAVTHYPSRNRHDKFDCMANRLGPRSKL
jgi:hypothetical protein